MLQTSTVKLRIEPTEELVKTAQLYQDGLNGCVQIGNSEYASRWQEVQTLSYPGLRELGLQSQLAMNCIRQACGMLKKSKSIPQVNSLTIRYNFPRSASYKNDILKLWTVKGRQEFPIQVPEYFQQYFDDWILRESLLEIKKNKSYFNFTFTKEIDTSSLFEHGKEFVLGIDLGVNRLAVTSDNRFFGKSIKALRKQHDRFVAQLQSKGTRASKRKLKKNSGTWTRFMKWVNHNISKEIIDGVEPGTVIAMENLTNIRRTAKYNPWVHKWAFRQLQSFIEYKALRKGCRVVYVNPAYTSKECNRCHNRTVRRHSGFIKCTSCGHSLNSDLNGARNIAQRYMRNMCRAVVNQPSLTCE